MLYVTYKAIRVVPFPCSESASTVRAVLATEPPVYTMNVYYLQDVSVTSLIKQMMMTQEQDWCICHTVTSALHWLVKVGLQRRALRILHKSRWFEHLSSFGWVELQALLVCCFHRLTWWHRNQRMLHKMKRKKHHSPDQLELGMNHMLMMCFWKVPLRLCHSQKNKDCWWRLQRQLASLESKWVRH